jgi:serine O-acetyltransferase
VPWKIETIVDDLRIARGRSKRVASSAKRTEPLPSPQILQKVVQGLFASMFPRHAGAPDYGIEGLAFFMGDALNAALHQLVEQIECEQHFLPAGSNSESIAPPDQIVTSFAQQLPRLYEILETDIRAGFEGDPSARNVEEVLLCFPGIRAIFHHRIAHALYKLGAPVVARIIAELSHSQTGIDIHPGAGIGASFFIDHGTGVVIGKTSVIGERVRLYQAVTLGAKRFSIDDSGALVKGQPRHPIVEDDVVIYAGATILGRVTIGRGSSIGGNVWLTRSVPAGSNIVQAQARSEVFDGGSGI